MKIIKTNKNEEILVSNEDYPLLNRLNWEVNKAGYVTTYIGGKHVPMHLLVCYRPSGKTIDHINRNKLDNRQENLRPVSFAQNSHNRSLIKNTETGFIGIRPNKKQEGHYLARIYTKGHKDVHVMQGYNIEELAMARDYVCLGLRGEYAVLNFPEYDYSQYTHPKKERLDKIIEKYK